MFNGSNVTVMPMPALSAPDAQQESSEAAAACEPTRTRCR